MKSVCSTDFDVYINNWVIQNVSHDGWFHPEDVVVIRSIEEVPDFVIDVHRRQCKSDLLLDWLLEITTTFKNDNDHKHMQRRNMTAITIISNFLLYATLMHIQLV